MIKKNEYLTTQYSTDYQNLSGRGSIQITDFKLNKLFFFTKGKVFINK